MSRYPGVRSVLLTEGVFFDIVKNLVQSPIIVGHQPMNSFREFGSKIIIIKGRIPFAVLNFRFAYLLEIYFSSHSNNLAK